MSIGFEKFGTGGTLVVGSNTLPPFGNQSLALAPVLFVQITVSPEVWPIPIIGGETKALVTWWMVDVSMLIGWSVAILIFLSRD